MKRVLVVEDSAPCSLLFSLVLEKAGYVVTVADSVPAAIVELRREIPDALVCDLLLGLTGNGYDVVIAARQTGERMLCIAITALPSPELECHALDAGFDILLRKPFLPSRLVELLA